MVKVLILLLAAAAPAGAALTQIGAAAAVSGMVKAVSQGEAVGRIVQSGKPLYLNDHVTTDDNGRLQVLLADETVFTLGPNSDMVLDEFVYDPATGAGKVSAKIVKGAFRFVTGKVARKDPEKMKVKLSVGTIGIRGTTVVGFVDPVAQRDTVILMDNGMAIVQTDGGSAWLRAPGFGTTLSNPMQPPPPPQPMGPAAAALMGQLAPPPPPQMGPGQQGQGQGQQGQPQGGSPAGSGQFSAEEQSGQNTANLFNSAQTTLLLAGLSGATNSEVTQATQDAAQPSVNPITTWDDIRNSYSGLGAVLYTGQGTYSGTVIGQPDGGVLNFQIMVDFANYTIGDDINNSSFISLDVPTSGNTDFQPLTYVYSHDFSVLSGNAILTLTNIDDPNFTGSSIALNASANSSTPAVVVNAVYNDVNNNSSVTGTGVNTEAPTPYVP